MTASARRLVNSLQTSAPPRTREEEARKARARSDYLHDESQAALRRELSRLRSLYRIEVRRVDA